MTKDDITKAPEEEEEGVLLDLSPPPYSPCTTNPCFCYCACRGAKLGADSRAPSTQSSEDVVLCPSEVDESPLPTRISINCPLHTSPPDLEEIARQLALSPSTELTQANVLHLTKRLTDFLTTNQKVALLDHIKSNLEPPPPQLPPPTPCTPVNTIDTKMCADFTTRIPNEMTLRIFAFLDPGSLLKCCCVNSTWQRLARDPLLYRAFCAQERWSVSPDMAQHQVTHYTYGEGEIDWFGIFKERYQLRRNWLQGRCKIRTFSGHKAGIACVAFDDRRIVSGSTDSTIRVWNIRTNAAWSAQSLVGHSEAVRCLQLLGDRLVSGSNDRSIKLWDLAAADSWSAITCRMTLTGHGGRVRCLQADQDKLVSGSYDHTLRLWCLRTGEHKQTYVGHEGPVLCVQFDDNKIISGSHDKTIKVWDWSGACLRTLHGHEDAVACLQFDQDRLVSGSHDCTLKMWRLEAGCQRTIDWKAGEGHSRVVRCLQVHGARMLSAADDKTIKLWNVESGERLCTFRRHTDGVTCLQFNDRMMVSGSYDMSVILWDFSVC